jgi:hypothetical protein
MFCQKCGTAMADSATACVTCSTPVLYASAAGGAVQVGAAPASAAAATVKSASRDALTAFKSLARDPVGGLAPAYGALGDARALRAGVAFGVVSLACFLLGGYLMLPEFMKEDLFEFLGFGGVVKCLLFALVPFVCTTAGSLAVRKAFGGHGGLGSDGFTAGAALLPASFAMLASGMVGLGNFEVVVVLAVFAGCIGTLMLFSGYTRIAKLSERVATLGVPLVILLSAWLAKVISTSVLSGGGGEGSDMPYPYPF